MKPNRLTLTSLALLSLGSSLQADVLELKNRSILNGRYLGGTADTIRFETTAGLQVIATSDIVALTFTTPPAAPAATPPPVAAPAPAPAATPAAVTPPPAAAAVVPAGTTLVVRVMDGVSSRSRSGAPFTTKLDRDLLVGGTVAIPAGTVVYGRVAEASQARRVVGRSTLDLRLEQVEMKSGPVRITTSSFTEAGQGSLKQAAGGAAAGAAIGAIAGDAGMGAAIGATAGALRKGETVTVPPGTLLEFKLTEAVTLKP